MRPATSVRLILPFLVSILKNKLLAATLVGLVQALIVAVEVLLGIAQPSKR